MSYILEALKKAQAERQLGSAPTIHALPIQAAPAAPSGSARAPLWIAVGAGALLAVAGGVMWWRQPAPAPQQAVVVPAPLPAAIPAPPAVAIPIPAPVPQQAVAVTQPPVKPAPPVARAKPAPVPAASPTLAAEPAPVPAPVSVPSAAAPEDALPFARELPEAQRRDLPQVVFGGYMYSKNPADRLLLIDKVLRHEGEEVAPGLTLEKLLPKAAVMNYRGTRYRVGY